MLTFYSTRLARQKFYLEKKFLSESSRVKFKNGIHSTRSSFHCFVSSEFRVLIEYFRRSIVILGGTFLYRRVNGVFGATKQWYFCCYIKWCFMCDIMFLLFQYLHWYFPFYHFLAYATFNATLFFSNAIHLDYIMLIDYIHTMYMFYNSKLLAPV